MQEKSMQIKNTTLAAHFQPACFENEKERMCHYCLHLCHYGKLNQVINNNKIKAFF